MDTVTLCILLLAVARLIRFVTRDALFDPIRNFASRTYTTHMLTTCAWCIGPWLSIAVYGAYRTGSELVWFGLVVLALSHGAALLNWSGSDV